MRYLILCLFLAFEARAQSYVMGGKLEGENIISSFNPQGNGLTQTGYVATANGLYETSAAGALIGTSRLLWSPSRGKKIVSFKQCVTQKNAGGLQFLVLLDDGTRIVLYSVNDLFYQQINPQGSLPGAPADGFKDFIGDAVYVLNTRGSSSLIWVSRDTGSTVGTTWQLDTAGLVGFVRNIALDSAQYVYAASYSGLFKQHPDSNVWHRDTVLALNDINAVFADRGHRLVVANRVWGPGWKTRIYISDDKGASWTLDTLGLGIVVITSFGDDAAGNIYAVGTNTNGVGSFLYRRMASTPGWTRIDQPLTRLSLDSTRTIIMGISGNDTVYATTAFGVFYSADHGTTWQGPIQTPAEWINGLLHPSANRFVASTTTGLFYHNVGDTTVWPKSYPDTGWLGGFSLMDGGPGEIFAQRWNGAVSTVLKSNNGGTSWTFDTAGRRIIAGESKFYVDETGGQFNTTNNNPPPMYYKPSGGTWAVDTGWRTPSGGYARGMGGDRAGNVFLSSDSGKVYRRPVSGGSWALDTALPIGATAYLQWFWTGRSGSVFASPFTGPLYTRSGGRWSSIPDPAFTPGAFSNHPSAVAVDSGGAVFAAYAGVFANLRGRGVYVTTNNGTTWTKLGLDSVIVNGIIAVGDTVYAATERGIFTMTRGGIIASAIHPISTMRGGWRLEPIRMNGSLVTATFQLAQRGYISLKVYDMRGQTVATLYSGMMEAGAHSISRDLSRIMPRGIYFCRLQARGYSKTRKFTARSTTRL